MGGAATEISDATTDVLLEMAWFDPMSIAGPSRRLGLRTEASARFEKGTDPEVIELAAARFAELLGVRRQRAPTPSTPGATQPDRPPGAPPHRAGQPAPRHRAHRRPRSRAQLDPIGFACTAGDGDDHDVAIPSWRPDSAVEIDVVEEVARHWGYDRIGADGPAVGPRRPPHARPAGAAAGSAAAWWASACRGDADAVPRARRPRPRRPRPTTASPSPTRWWPRSRSCARRCCPAS